jgi:hypothetical protein
VQTGDSRSIDDPDRAVKRTARKAGGADVGEGVDATLQRTAGHTRDLLENGDLPDLADIRSVTDPMRSVVENRLSRDLPLPGLDGLAPDVGDVLSPEQQPATVDESRHAVTYEQWPSSGVRRDAAVPSDPLGQSLVSASQIDWTGASHAGSSDTGAGADRAVPASPNPLPFAVGDVLTTSSTSTGGFDLAVAGRLVGEAAARAGAFALGIRNESVFRAVQADHPGFSPD